MITKKRLACGAALMVLVAVLMPLMNASAYADDITTPLVINGDDDLASKAVAHGWSGDGTLSNPYLISDAIIETPDTGLGIFVSGTTKHLVIDNCVITNSTSYAIDIVGASNVTVRDTDLYGCFCGVMFYSSSDCVLIDGATYRCKTGVQLMSSDNILISNNTFQGTENNGIELFNSDRNTITGNHVKGSGSYGLYLFNSNNNTVYGNIFEENNGAGASYSTDHPQAYDPGNNIWSVNGHGNTWSDWSSSSPYPCEGSAAADDVLNSISMEDILPMIAVAIIAVVAVAAAVLVIKRKRARAGQSLGQIPGQQQYPPFMPARGPADQSLKIDPLATPKRKWVPAAVAGVVLVVVVLVLASTMGWFSVGSGKLSGARDISGDWEGTGTFWNYNLFGDKGMLVEATFHMKITLNGNHVTGVLDIYPVSQTKITDDIAVMEPENHLSIDGNYEITTLTFETYNTAFEFAFLTDMATGKMTNTDDNTYLGLGSDAGAIHLQRA